jgi:hypothetical protein
MVINERKASKAARDLQELSELVAKWREAFRDVRGPLCHLTKKSLRDYQKTMRDRDGQTRPLRQMIDELEVSHGLVHFNPDDDDFDD